jgi:hypothetical protein
MNAMPFCWICRRRPADSGEHRWKASDLRRLAPGVSQRRPFFLQQNSVATNALVGSVKSKALMFPRSICRYCNNAGISRYDDA